MACQLVEWLRWLCIRANYAPLLAPDSELDFESRKDARQGVNAWQLWRAKNGVEKIARAASEYVKLREYDYADEDRWRTKLMQRQAALVGKLEDRIDGRFAELAEALAAAGTISATTELGRGSVQRSKRGTVSAGNKQSVKLSA